MIRLQIFKHLEFGDKNFNLQFTNLSEDDKRLVYGFVRTEPVFEPVKAFFQGDSGDWLMLEFWQGNADQKRAASLALIDHLGNDRVTSEDFEKLKSI